jgi:hypothetical protein
MPFANLIQSEDDELEPLIGTLWNGLGWPRFFFHYLGDFQYWSTSLIAALWADSFCCCSRGSELGFPVDMIVYRIIPKEYIPCSIVHLA